MGAHEEVSIPLDGRAAAMAERLAIAARRVGMDERGAESVVRAFQLAMRPRIEHLPDDRHPDFLHPARTALILMEDLGVDSPDVVAAGVLAETLYPEFVADPADVDGRMIRELLRRLPMPAGEGDYLAEALEAAPEAVRLIALAERLDHARHLHLREPDEWAAFHDETCRAYRPVAAETHPTLARRYDWWCRMFARRYLRIDGNGARRAEDGPRHGNDGAH